MLSQLAEFAVKIALVYIALGLVCSIALELVEIFMKRRSRYLRSKLSEMLGKETTEQLYAHPLIKSLATGPRRLPSYIPGQLFAKVLLQVIGSEANSEPLKESLSVLLSDKTQATSENNLPWGSPTANMKPLVGWFDSAMDSLSSLYRRRSLLMIAGIGFALAGILNIDLIELSTGISEQSSRQQITLIYAREIAKLSKPASTATGSENEWLSEVRKEIDYLTSVTALPIGWSKPLAGRVVLQHFVGWILTALVICLTAPLAFDLMNKVSFIRIEMKPREFADFEEESKL